jgi:hypothetical protein
MPPSPTNEWIKGLSTIGKKAKIEIKKIVS